MDVPALSWIPRVSTEAATSEWVFYTVYERPRDYPHEYVVRCHRVRGDDLPVTDADLFARGRTLEEVRRRLPAGLEKIGPWSGDSPSILEVWLKR